MNLLVRTIELNELKLVVQLLNQLPEFDTVFYEKQLAKQLSKPESIMLIAENDGKPAGCKVAYNRYFDGSVYSWLGGVLPEFRNQGIAQALLDELEKEARKKLFLKVRMKTWNKHKAMLCFALKNDFRIIGFHEMEDTKESRIDLIKKL